MALEIKRIQDRVKLDAGEVQRLIGEFVAKETGREVSAVEIHVGRNEFGAATVYLEFKD